MFRNYLLITWRNLRKSKTFSAINISGLTLGLTCSLLIFLWVADERSVDNGQANGNRIYILYEKEFFDGQKMAGYWTPGLLATELKRRLPEVEAASGQRPEDGATFEANGKIIQQSGAFADSDYFRILNFPMLRGNAATALNTPSAIAISESMARRFFGSAEVAIGKAIRHNNRESLTISAVYTDFPATVSQKFDYLINWATCLDEASWLRSWDNNSPQTLMILKANADPARVEAKLTRFLDPYQRRLTPGFRLDLHMQRYGDTYLHSNFVNGEFSGGRIEYVRLFTLVALFIVFIACINFMNLTTARSVKRAREIGIRKVAGAIRGSLVRQFLCEAVFITAIAVGLSLLLVSSLLPYFNQFTDKQIVFPSGSPGFWLSLAALTLVTGLVAGSYPAFFLSGFQPIRVLKGAGAPGGKSFSGGGSLLLRKGLVVFQFVLSIVLIIATVVVSKQINYIQHSNLGFDKEGLVSVPLQGELAGKYSVFRQEALQLRGVKGVSVLSDDLTSIGGNITGTVNWTGKPANSNTQFTITAAGYDLVSTLHLSVIRGRDFSRDYPSDSSAYLINEKALAILGYKDPIGMPLELWGKKGTIVGVLKDFHLTSLQRPITPLIVHLSEAGEGGNMIVRTAAGSPRATIAALSAIGARLNPKFPFVWSFVDQDYLKLYKNEEIIGRIADCFAGLAIFISCMGLLGLAMFTAEQRTREIGIRKVLGAGFFSLFGLLSGEFLLLVGIALVIATPLAGWAMHAWLSDYAYHVPITAWIFLFAGAAALLIALATVSFQAIAAALRNPVRSLRAE